MTKCLSTPTVPVSWGELLDKITILEIKAEQLKDATKLAHVNHEYDELTAVAHEATQRPDVQAARAELREVNQKLWVVEDDLRKCERAQQFDERFIALARSVYRLNDERAAIKKRINVAVGSALVEEKSYEAY